MSPEKSRHALVEALEKLMHAMSHEHARLLELLEEKRRAVGEAQMQKIGELADREREIARRIQEMDRHRQELLRRIAPLIGARAEEPLSVSRIAAAVDEPQRSEIEHAAQQLRERVEAVRHASSVVRTAAEALANHMAGVMQRVNWALSRAGVYGSSGRVAVGAQMDFCVDLKT